MLINARLFSMLSSPSSIHPSIHLPTRLLSLSVWRGLGNLRKSLYLSRIFVAIKAPRAFWQVRGIMPSNLRFHVVFFLPFVHRMDIPGFWAIQFNLGLFDVFQFKFERSTVIGNRRRHYPNSHAREREKNRGQEACRIER